LRSFEQIYVKNHHQFYKNLRFKYFNFKEGNR